MYQKVFDPNGTVLPSLVRRQADGAIIPVDPANPDWQSYQAWIAAGNSPTETPPLSLPPRQALGSALRDALKAQSWDAAWTAAMALQSDDTRAWWVSAYRDLVPITATKLVRVAGACAPKVDLDRLFTAAGA